jgi:hypothetical protein
VTTSPVEDTSVSCHPARVRLPVYIVAYAVLTCAFVDI